MILRTSPSSPFGRKVKILAIHCGLMGGIHLEHVNTLDPDENLLNQNPLGKIPVLVLDSGVSIYDSQVICEFLDSFSEGPRFFPQGPERWGALTLSALADGIIEAALSQVYEVRYRPEDKRHEDWQVMQSSKVKRGLDLLENNVPHITQTPNIGHLTLACALGYLDFRFEGSWRDTHTNLVSWLDVFSNQVPAYSATMPGD